ncbi:unnamed protein product [Owenia fusiformis]|uniref:Uncharacterized protein n=1 Tax=Owenia fusiformis TaxID=6347 RepID=A0A8J1TVG2_OWEFU|nr:unnamed protein product [Owenia fusiformis]
MGKKNEKGGKDKGQTSSASQDGQDDDPNKTPEPYNCTGKFFDDFTELCRRNQMVVIPTIVPRPKRPPSPNSMPAPDAKESKGKGKDKENKQPEPEPEQELDENGEPIEPLPKTYTTKEKFEYFKPCIQVEMEHPDKQDTVTELFIRGWKIDEPMMGVFQQTWPLMEKLHTITLWHTGLTGDSIKQLAGFLPLCPNLRNLILDGNPNKTENWHELIKEESLVVNLSLRHNWITDKGATLLAKALGSATGSNTKLLQLNLTGNRITDDGAIELANGLRMNRTLLTLGLGNNLIGDRGVKKISEMLSRFPLTHTEVVERRKLLSEKGSPERQKSPPPSRRADSKDRPGSVRSSSHAKTKGDKSAKKKDDKKDDKGHDKTKGKKDDKDKTKGRDSKGSKAHAQASSSGRNSGASLVSEAGKTMGKTKDKKGGKDKKGQVQQETEPEVQEVINPLLETVESMDGQLWIPGNRVLISLNLSRNQIGEDGMKSLLLAVQYQTTLLNIVKGGGSGLMRLCLHKNNLPGDNEHMTKLNDIMLTKDPFYKPPPKTPDEELQS